MRLLLLHGSAEHISRQKLSEIKRQFDNGNIQVVDSFSSVKDVMGALMSLPLISEKRLVILEEPTEDIRMDQIADSDDLTLVVWFGKELAEKSSVLKFVKEKKGEILYFPPEKETSVFPFLDMLGNKDKRAFVELKKLKKNGSDTQYLITMILYLLRSLAVPNKKAPSFVQQKTQKQRQNFPNLSQMYKFVLETDFKLKSGLLEKPQAEFDLVNKFTG